MLVDHDVALIMGREFMGFPKNSGEISLQLTDGVLNASVKRGTTTLMEATGTVGAVTTGLNLGWPMSLLNVYGGSGQLSNIGVELLNPADVPQPRLLYIKSSNEITEMTAVDIDFTLTGSEGDAIDEMGLLAVQGAMLLQSNLGNLTTPWQHAFLDEVDQEYQNRVWALRYGNPR
jgi:hypothetical protein